MKCRIGIDDRDSYEFFAEFVDAVAAAGVDALIVHARAAILGGLTRPGLSPKGESGDPAAQVRLCPSSQGRAAGAAARHQRRLHGLPVGAAQLAGAGARLEGKADARLEGEAGTRLEGKAGARLEGEAANAAVGLDGVMLGRAAYHKPGIAGGTRARGD